MLLESPLIVDFHCKWFFWRENLPAKKTTKKKHLFPLEKTECVFYKISK